MMQRFFSPNSPLMKVMKWIERMFHVQFLWILYSLRGLVVAGLFPATAAMFATMRRLIRIPGGFGLNDYFKKEYKANFKKANGLGYLLVILLFLFILNFRSAQLMEGTAGMIFVILSFVMIVVLFLLLISSWGVMAHYELGILEIIKHTLIIFSVNPLHVVLLLISLVVFGWASWRLGILLPLVLFSMLAYIVMWLVYDAANRASGRTETDEEKE